MTYEVRSSAGRRAGPRIIAAVALALALAASPVAAFAEGVPPASASADQRKEAEKLFLEGKDLYGAGNYEEALAKFKASHDVVASPNARLYVGRCLRELGRDAEAYDELRRTAVEARSDERYAKTAEAADEERAELDARVGLVELEIANASPETTVEVAGRGVPRESWSEPVPVAAGGTNVVVSTPGKKPIERRVEVVAGQKAPVKIDAEADVPPDEVAPPPEPAADGGREKLRTYAYVAGGVGVAGLATFTIAGLMAGSTYSDLQDACGAGPCPPGHEDDISSGRTQQTIANVGLVIGILGAATAVTLYVLSTPKSDARQARIVVRGTGVGLEGTF